MIFIKTLERALDILEAIEREPDGLNAEQLAQLIDSNKTTTYKLATVFCRYGYLRRIPHSTKYKLGVKFLEMAKNVDYGSDIRSAALPEMYRLANLSGETINLMVLSGTKGLYVEVLESAKSAKLASHVGSLDYLHVSAVGKVLMCGMSEAMVENIVAVEGLPKTGANTITTLDALKAELIQVKKQGFAIDDEESVPGAQCVGAPIYNSNGQIVAAISISTLTIYSEESSIAKLTELVTASAKIISDELSSRQA